MKLFQYILRLKYLKKAKELLADKDKFKELISSVTDKINKENLKNEADKLKDLVSLAMDYIKGDYKDISKRNIIYLIIALLYFLNPLDFIPDIILGLGFLDDFTVITFIYGKINHEVIKYRQWKDKKD